MTRPNFSPYAIAAGLSPAALGFATAAYPIPTAAAMVGVAFTVAAPLFLLGTAIAFPVRFAAGPLGSLAITDLALLLVSVRLWPRLRHYIGDVPSPTRGAFTVVLALCVYSGVSSLWAPSAFEALRVSYIALQQAVLAAVAYAVVCRYGWRRFATGWSLFGAGSVVLAAVWFLLLNADQSLTLQPATNAADLRSQMSRLGSPQWGPSNYFGSILLLFLFPAVSVASRKGGSRWLIWCPFVILAGIVGTLSRGAILAAGVGLVVYAAFSGSGRRGYAGQRMVRGGIAAVAGAFVGYSVLQSVVRYRSQFRPGELDLLTANGREAIAAAADALGNPSPLLGQGAGAWRAIHAGESLLSSGTHNYYLTLYYELGVAGLLVFASLFIWLLWSAWRADDRAWKLALLVAVSANISVEASFEGVVFAWLFAIVAGAVTNRKGANDAGPPIGGSSSRLSELRDAA